MLSFRIFEAYKGRLPHSSLPQITSHFTRLFSNTVAGPKKFSLLEDLDPDLFRAVNEDIGYKNMTRVQRLALPLGIKGEDLLIKARPGTGKRLAYLIPTIQRVLRRRRVGAQTYLRMIVVTPTTECAKQAAEEARRVLSQHPKIVVHQVYGGNNIFRDIPKLKQRVPDILIGTPARLEELVRNHPKEVAVDRLKFLVLDELDQILDLGLETPLRALIAALPKADRQTLVVSATMPPPVKEVAGLVLRVGHTLVDSVSDDPSKPLHVPQDVVVVPLETHLAALVLQVKKAMREHEHFKIIVYCSTNRFAEFYAKFLKQFWKVFEVHTRRPDEKRKELCARFRKETQVLMCSSDFSAEQVMDPFPDVTCVIQMGSPLDKDVYIKRLAQTARYGKEGKGVLILHEDERFFLQYIGNLGFRRVNSPESPPTLLNKVKKAIAAIPIRIVNSAYIAFLGFTHTQRSKSKLKKEDFVNQANKWFSAVCFRDVPPRLHGKTIRGLGLEGVPGVRTRGPDKGAGSGEEGGEGEGDDEWRTEDEGDVLEEEREALASTWEEDAGNAVMEAEASGEVWSDVSEEGGESEESEEGEEGENDGVVVGAAIAAAAAAAAAATGGGGGAAAAAAAKAGGAISYGDVEALAVGPKAGSVDFVEGVRVVGSGRKPKKHYKNKKKKKNK